MINVVISCDPRYKVGKSVIEEAVLKTLKEHGVTGKVEVEVNIVGDRKMHELNLQYRQLDETTDILTFAFEDPNPQYVTEHQKTGFISPPDKCLRLGLIVISYPQALKYAAEDLKSLEEEIGFLTEHGTKHLLGIHHSHE